MTAAARAARGDGSPSPYRATIGPAPAPDHPARIDLHAHSLRSDGVLEPADLVRAAAAAGVRVLAIADHDTLAAHRELTRAGAPVPADISVLPAVEINSVADEIPDLWEGELHILGLEVDPDDGAFEATLAGQRDGRRTRLGAMVTRLRELGLGIDPLVERFPIPDEAAAGRPHLARLLVRAGHARDVDDAMVRLLARGRPGWVPRVGLGPAEAIRAIRRASGLPVLAHFAAAPNRIPLLRDLKLWGLGGLEVHYRAFGVDVVAALASVAAAERLVPTAGTDYHGDAGSYAEAHARLAVPAAVEARWIGRADAHQRAATRGGRSQAPATGGLLQSADR